VRTSESLKAEDAGPWGVWCLGGLKNTPQLAPGEHRTVGGSNRTPGHTSTRGVGLTWLTTADPLAWEAGLDVMGFFEQVRTSC
jgi:hypothetical protein